MQEVSQNSIFLLKIPCLLLASAKCFKLCSTKLFSILVLFSMKPTFHYGGILKFQDLISVICDSQYIMYSTIYIYIYIYIYI